MCEAVLPALIAGLDSCIKRHREENDTVYDCLDGNIRIVTYHNTGAFMEAGADKPAAVTALSVMFTLFAGIAFIAAMTKTGFKTLKTGLGLLLGGAFSNTHDRVTKGYVTDYLIFSKAPGVIHNMVFNLSDFAIIIGALISAFH